MEGWDSFFLGHVGASAALGGLLFVAVSLNLARILSFPALPDRALMALSLLLAILVVSSLMLVPDQPWLIRGLEILVVGLALVALGIVSYRRAPAGGTAADRSRSKVSLILSGVAVMPYLIGGAMIMAGLGRAGLYIVAAAITLSLVKAVLDAWVLLVEINR